MKSQSSNRSFGLLFFIVFIVVGLWPVIKGEAANIYLILISLFFLILGLINSKILSPFNKAWIKFGEILGLIIAPIIMALVYFIILTPISLIVRMLGKDLLGLKFLKKQDTYWTRRKKKIRYNEKTVLNDRFFERILGIFKRKKKILAITNYNCPSFIWSVNCFEPRISSGSIHIYNFLSDIYFRHISILSR